jgi:hypothetical protein
MERSRSLFNLFVSRDPEQGGCGRAKNRPPAVRNEAEAGTEKKDTDRDRRRQMEADRGRQRHRERERQGGVWPSTARQTGTQR